MATHRRNTDGVLCRGTESKAGCAVHRIGGERRLGVYSAANGLQYDALAGGGWCGEGWQRHSRMFPATLGGSAAVASAAGPKYLKKQIPSPKAVGNACSIHFPTPVAGLRAFVGVLARAIRRRKSRLRRQYIIEGRRLPSYDQPRTDRALLTTPNKSHQPTLSKRAT